MASLTYAVLQDDANEEDWFHPEDIASIQYLSSRVLEKDIYLINVMKMRTKMKEYALSHLIFVTLIYGLD